MVKRLIYSLMVLCLLLTLAEIGEAAGLPKVGQIYPIKVFSTDESQAAALSFVDHRLSPVEVEEPVTGFYFEFPFGVRIDLVKLYIPQRTGTQYELQYLSYGGSWLSVPGFSSISDEQLAEEWNRIPIQPGSHTRFRLMVSGKNAAVPAAGEVQFWGEYEQPVPFRTFPAWGENPVAFHTDLPHRLLFPIDLPAYAVKKAELVYELFNSDTYTDGHWNINDQGQHYLAAAGKPGAWVAVTEEIDPGILRQDENVISFQSNRPEKGIQIRNVAVRLYVDTGIVEVKEVKGYGQNDHLVPNLTDGDLRTTWESQWGPVDRASVEMLLASPTDVEWIAWYQEKDFVDGVRIEYMTENGWRLLAEEQRRGRFTEGWNLFRANTSCQTTRLRFTVLNPYGKELMGSISELLLWGSAVKKEPELVIAYPGPGERVVHPLLLKAFVKGEADEIAVNGVRSSLTNGYIEVPVKLDSRTADHRLVIQALRNGAVVDERELHVYTGSRPELVIQSPEDGQLTPAATVRVSGKTNAEENRVWINGKQIPTDAASFHAEVPLHEGLNQIGITAAGPEGTMTKRTLYVRRDSQRPRIDFGVDPAKIVVREEPSVHVLTGTIVDYSRCRLYINGTEVSISNGRFTYPVPLKTGYNDVTVRVVDELNQETEAEVTILADSTPPAGFTPVVTQRGLKQPVLQFETIDGQSKVHHYEVKVDDGRYATAVSPCILSGLAKGVHKVHVKAVDDAGNAIVATISVSIDAEPDRLFGSNGTVDLRETQTGTGVTLQGSGIGMNVPAQALPGDCHIQVTSLSSGEIPASVRPVIGNSYRIRVVDEMGQVVDQDFAQSLTITLNYDETLIPAGYTEGDLNIYCYDELDACWQIIPVRAQDCVANTISFKNSKAAIFSIQSSVTGTFTEDTYRDLGISPYQTYFRQNEEYVSPSSGNLVIHSTDVELKGRNGFDLRIGRVYNTLRAVEDITGVLDSPTGATHYRKMFLGVGWEWDLPHIEGDTYGQRIYLEDGAAIECEWYVVSGSSFSLNRELSFEYHQGVHFTARKVQARENILKPWKDVSTEITLKDGSRYVFDGQGKIRTMIDRTGENKIEFVHAGQRISTITDSVGRSVGFTYDPASEMCTEITVNGQVWVRYGYGGNQLQTVTDRGNRVTRYDSGRYTYKTGGEVYIETEIWDCADDFMDHSNPPHYEQNNVRNYEVPLITKVTYPMKGQTRYAYSVGGTESRTINETRTLVDPEHNVYTYTRRGSSVIYNYKARVDTTAQALADSSAEELNLTTYRYHTVTSEVRELIGKRYVTYEKTYINRTETGQKNRKTVTEFNHDGSNSVKRIYHRPGKGYTDLTPDEETKWEVKETYQYDDRKNMTVKTVYHAGQAASSYTETFTYDNWGNVTSRRNSVSNETYYYTYYNTNSVVPADANFVAYTPAPATVPDGTIHNLIAYEFVLNYDSVRKVSTPLETHYRYDGKGNPVTKAKRHDGRWVSIEMAYDQWGNLTRITEAGIVTQFSYDSEKHADPVKMEKDAGKNADGVSQGTKVTQYGYDSFGRKVWEIDSMGGLTEFGYDTVGRLEWTKFPDATDQYSGVIGALNPTLYLPASRQDNPVKLYVYDDSKNTITAADLTTGTASLEYAKTAVRAVTSTLPAPVSGGLAIQSMARYVYDGLNRWTELRQYLKAGELYTINNEVQTSPFVTRFGHDEFGNRVRETDPEGYVTFKVYDGLNRLTRIYYPDGVKNKGTYDANNSYTELAYTNQPASQKVTVTDSMGNVKEEWKDWKGRVTEVVLVDKKDGNKRYSTRFTYDSLDNQIQVTQGLINGAGTPRIYQYVYNDWNQLKQEILPVTEVLQPGWTAAGAKTPMIRYEYDDLGRRTAVVDANGTVEGSNGGYRMEYTYDSGENIVKIAQVGYAKRLETRNYYDKSGRLIKTVNPESEAYQTVYNPQGWVMAEVDPLGQITYYQYNAFGLKTAVTDPRGVTITENTGGPFKLNGKSYTVTLNPKYTTIFAYDSLGREVKTTDALGTQYVTRYNRSGAKVEESVIPATANPQADQIVTAYTYIPRGWIESVTREGYTTRYEYNADGTKSKEIYPPVQGMGGGSNSYTYSYDGLGQLIKAVRPDQSTEEYRYDAFGNRISVKNGRSFETTYQYNCFDKLTEVIEPTGSRTVYYYELNGNLAQIKQSNGLTTDYEYNDLNQLTGEEKTRAGQKMSYQYIHDNAGRKITVADPKGNITAYQYNDAGMATREVHYLPEAGAPLPDLTKITPVMTAENLRSIRYGKESEISYQYDAAGNLVGVTDRLGTQAFTLDELGRVTGDTRKIDGKTYTTRYQYDFTNNVRGILYPGSPETEWVTYEYNKLSQLQSVSGFADDRKTASPKNFVYDPAGNLVQMRYNNGVVTTITPDRMGRPAGIAVNHTAWSGNAVQLNYVYDANGNITRRNNNEYSYDQLDRLTRATVEGKVLMELVPVVGYVYGDYAATAAINYQVSDQKVKFDYAAPTFGLKFARESQIERIDLIPETPVAHRVTKDGIRIFRKGAAESGFTEIAADQWDFRKDDQTGGIMITFRSVVRAVEMKIHSNYDDRDIVTGVIRDQSTFTHYLKRMVRVYESTTRVTMAYDYDSVGNRTKETVTNALTQDGVAYSYTYYAGSDRLKSRTSTAVSGFTGDIHSELGGNPSFGPARSMGYSYDVAGNLVAKGSSYTDNGSITYTRKSGENVAYWDYRYDAQNQLAAVFRYGETDPVKAVARYGYNYAGQRQKVVEGNRVTHYIYNLSGQVIQEVGYTVAGGDPFTAALPAAGEVTSYVHANGRQIAKVEGRPLQSGARYYMHHDNLGSTVLVTQASGSSAAVVYKQDYLPFGQSINVTGAENAGPDFKFTGQYEDRDTGLYYYGARYYDPEIGRFTQEDTYSGSLEVPGTQNLYVYTLNNPLKYVDPTGHSPQVAHDSDWEFLFGSQPDENSNVSWAIYINSQGQSLFSLVTKDISGTRITNTYYLKDGKFDHVDVKDFALNGSKAVNSTKQSATTSDFEIYLQHTADYMVRGNASPHVTLLGVGGQVALGIAGLDLPGDIRDLVYDFTHWEWSVQHGVQTVIDGIGLIPGIGSVKPILVGICGLKYADEAASLLKHSDELGVGVKSSNIEMTNHGKQRAQLRGFSDAKINDILQNYSHKVYQPGGKTVYAKKNGKHYDVVIVNKEGKIITTVGGKEKTLKNWSDVTTMLNNNGGYSSLPID